jgi:hypothetical protein
MCVAITERFIADHPDVRYEDIGIAPGRQT